MIPRLFESSSALALGKRKYRANDSKARISTESHSIGGEGTFPNIYTPSSQRRLTFPPPLYSILLSRWLDAPSCLFK